MGKCSCCLHHQTFLGLKHSDVLYGIFIPRGCLDIAEFLTMLSSLCSNLECGLVLMLIKWNIDGLYFEAELNYLQKREAAFRVKFPTLPGLSIFRYVNDHVASHKKYLWTKLCLKIDFKQAQHEDPRKSESILSTCSISSALRWFHESESVHRIGWSIIKTLSWSTPPQLALFHRAVSLSSFQLFFLSTPVSSILPKPCQFASQSSIPRFLEVLRCFVSIPMIIFSLLSSRWRYFWRLVGPRGIFDRFSAVRVWEPEQFAALLSLF